MKRDTLTIVIKRSLKLLRSQCERNKLHVVTKRNVHQDQRIPTETPKLNEFVVKQLDAVAFKGQGFNLKKKQVKIFYSKNGKQQCNIV